MYRYAQVDLQAVIPARVIRLVETSETDEMFEDPDYIDVSDRPEITAGSWYDATLGEFVDEPPYVEPEPTPEQILASQSAILVSLKAEANAQKTALNNRVSELNDAIEYDVATPAETAELPLRIAQRKAWGLYAIELGRVTTQAGWPPDVVWPTKPTEGMDLTVSAAAPEIV